MAQVYDLYSIRKTFLPYIFYGKGLVILSVLAFAFGLDLDIFFERYDRDAGDKVWLLYTSYGFLILTAFFGVLLFKAGIYCVFKVAQSIKKAKKSHRDMIQKLEKRIFIYLYAGAFCFSFAICALGFYVVVNW